MVDPSRIRMEGPLAPYRDGLWAFLLSEGYTPLSSRNLLHLAAHVSRWLFGTGYQLEGLCPERVEEYLRHRRRAGYRYHSSRRSLDPMLRFLQSIGVLPISKVTATEETPLDEVLREYEQFLVHERGMVSEAVQRYVGFARRFLSGSFGDGVLEFGSLTAVDVTSFVQRESSSCSVAYAKLKVTALRSVLRYLRVRGDLTTDLAAAVPSVSGRRLSGLPRSLKPDEVKKLLQSCDRRRHVGRRDYAVLLLLVRLGLRAGEVAALRLGDVDWDRGEIVVHGKGNREDSLPLPHDVGEAMASFLKRRHSRRSSRRIFLQVRAPFRDMTRQTVGSIVRQAGQRCGIPSIGSHRLRHTAATQMLRRGASLPEIAQVLRHRHPDTTAIYAKVDRDALRPLCRPWPGGES